MAEALSSRAVLVASRSLDALASGRAMRAWIIGAQDANEASSVLRFALRQTVRQQASLDLPLLALIGAAFFAANLAWNDREDTPPPAESGPAGPLLRLVDALERGEIPSPPAPSDDEEGEEGEFPARKVFAHILRRLETQAAHEVVVPATHALAQLMARRDPSNAEGARRKVYRTVFSKARRALDRPAFARPQAAAFMRMLVEVGVVQLAPGLDAAGTSDADALLDLIVDVMRLPLWERPTALDVLLMTRPEVDETFASPEFLANALVAWG